MTESSKTMWIRAALRRFEGPLLRYAASITGDDERARDVVQETFLHLCQAERSQIETHLAAWLFRVCRNRALDLRRKETRMQSLEPVAEARLPSREPGPAAVAERSEGTAHLMEIVKTLPDNQREVMYLRFQSGLSYKEISAITGHSVSYVGVLIHGAVKIVRERMTAGFAARPSRASAGGTR
ncbi:MAG: sigma-70 family RNA polymerase sigma factor [Myxococcota bacterium]